MDEKNIIYKGIVLKTPSDNNELNTPFAFMTKNDDQTGFIFLPVTDYELISDVGDNEFIISTLMFFDGTENISYSRGRELNEDVLNAIQIYARGSLPFNMNIYNQLRDEDSVEEREELWDYISNIFEKPEIKEDFEELENTEPIEIIKKFT